MDKETALPLCYTGEYAAAFGTEYYCGRCGVYITNLLFTRRYNYCPHCGQKIDWESKSGSISGNDK